MIGLLDIETFEFKNECISKAYSFLQKAGAKSFEAVALFAGRIDGRKALITDTICPLQESSRSYFGLWYTVDGEELHRINTWLYSNKLTLIAQIHTHPTEAYHSETDDTFPIVTTLGGLSIVVPYFAEDDLNHLVWAYFRLDSDSVWIELKPNQIKKLIKII